MKRIAIYFILGMTTLFGQTFYLSSVYEFRRAPESAAMNYQDDTIILAEGALY